MKIAFNYSSKKNDLLGQEVILVLSFSKNNFCYLIVDKENKTLIEIKEFNLNNSKLELSSNEISSILWDLKKQYPKIAEIKTLNESKLFTLVPKELFNSEDSYKLLQFSEGSKVNLECKIDISEHNFLSNEIILLSQSDKFLINLSEIFELNIINFNSFQVFIDSIIKNQSTTPGAYINVENNFFDIIIHNSEKLLLANRFYFKSAKDFCYFAIGAIHSTEQNPLEQNLFITGKIMLESEIINLLKRYVLDIKLLETPNINNKDLNHQFYNQLSVL